MADQNRSCEQREKQMAEQLWLEYFNTYLFEHGVITEKERNRMVSEIAAYQNRKHQNHPKSQNNHCYSEMDML